MYGMAVDAAGNNLVTTGWPTYSVRIIAARSGTRYGQLMQALHIYTLAPQYKLGYPQGVAVDAAGNVVIADPGAQTVRVLAVRSATYYGIPMTAGRMYTVAGTGTSGYGGDSGPARQATFNGPASVAVDPAGNLVIADSGNNAIRVVAARSGTFYGEPMTAGDIYTVPTGGVRPMNDLAAVTVDGAGNIVAADYGFNYVQVIAGSTGMFDGQPMTTGHSYVVAGNGTEYGFGGCSGAFSGNAIPAARAQFGCPQGLTQDRQGNIFAADTAAFRVRVIAAQTGTFYGQAMTAGNLYPIAGTGTQGFSGNGGPATAAQLSGAEGLAIDAHGNVLVADANNAMVRIIAAQSGQFYGISMTAGHIYALAGTEICGTAGNGALATTAETCPQSLAIDPSGNVLITEYGRLQVLAAKSGTFYGVPMTADHLYAVAGNGSSRFAGDSGPLASTRFSGVFSIYASPAGQVIIADGPRLRAITS
jgi:trimeric autotransporter adhesin